LTTALINQQSPGRWVLANESGDMNFIDIDSSGNLSTGNTPVWNDPIDGLAKVPDTTSPFLSLQTGPGMFTLINNIDTVTTTPKYFIGVKVSSP